MGAATEALERGLDEYLEWNGGYVPAEHPARAFPHFRKWLEENNVPTSEAELERQLASVQIDEVK